MIKVLLVLMALVMAVGAAMLVLLARQFEEMRANMLTNNRRVLELTRRVNQYYEDLAR